MIIDANKMIDFDIKSNKKGWHVVKSNQPNPEKASHNKILNAAYAAKVVN